MEFDYSYLKNLLDHNEEESLKLEFKNSEALKNKKEVAKDASAMANSAGGLIIYGLNEEDHKGSSLSPVDGDKYNKEWLENILISNIHRPIKELKIHPIRIDNKISETVYVVEIPESDDSPHMASNNRYYRRHNFQSIPMDEYEVRSLYFKTKSPDLFITSIINEKSVELETHHNEQYIFCKPSFQVINEGKGISFNHKIVMEMGDLSKYSLSADALRTNNTFSQSLSENEGRIISIYDKTPIFPGELASIGNFKFGYPLLYIVDDEIGTKEFKIKILFDSGEDYLELSLQDLYQRTDYKKYL